jgi:hypothetical protein
VVAGGVRLSEVSWRRFLPALRALRPDLVDAYEEIIRRRSPRRTRYREKLDARIEQARARFGFNRGAFPSMKPDEANAPQLGLF